MHISIIAIQRYFKTRTTFKNGTTFTSTSSVTLNEYRMNWMIYKFIIENEQSVAPSKRILYEQRK